VKKQVFIGNLKFTRKNALPVSNGFIQIFLLAIFVFPYIILLILRSALLRVALRDAAKLTKASLSICLEALPDLLFSFPVNV